ncbi:hypothetical protein [Oleiharenicola sp. Vm1]|uniref:hypothetical protein n=1 Tax=Oleiharenicola sp. Vm1 TaxID=3398393 RepID=UPI0039F4D9E3
MIDHTCGALIDACIVGVPAAQKRAVVADLYRQARAGVKQAEMVRRFEDAISKMEYTPSKDRFDALADIVADMNASITRQLNGGINAYRLTIKGKVELPDARFGEFLRGSMSTAIDRLARAGALLVYRDGELVLTNELESLVPGWDLPAPKMTWECL